MSTDTQKLERELDHFKEQYFDLLDKLASWGLDPRYSRPPRQFVAYWLEVYQSEDTQAANLAAQKRHQEYIQSRLATPKQPDIKMDAQNAVNAAVAAGKLPRIKTVSCQDCGEMSGVYHHESYEKCNWLNVVPLCHKCHRRRHHPKSKPVQDATS